MYITLRNLKNETFRIEAESFETVWTVKERIQAVKGEGYLAANQKLISAGRVLENDLTLSHYGIDEQHIIVVMIIKRVATQASPSTNEPSTHAETDPTENIVGCTILDRLKNLGYTDDQIGHALTVSSYNINLAADCLTHGMFGGPGEADAPSYDDLTCEDDTDESDEESLGFLRSDPQFLNMKQVVLEDPSKLISFAREASKNNPELLRLISRNQNAFYRMLIEPTDSTKSTDSSASSTSSEEPAPPYIVLTPEEMEVIDRLKDLGFPEYLVIEAYFACDKDEAMSANYLFSQADEDDL